MKQPTNYGIEPWTVPEYSESYCWRCAKQVFAYHGVCITEWQHEETGNPDCKPEDVKTRKSLT